MGKALHKLGLWMDDFTIKKKFYIFYVVCVLIPLIVTDSVVFLTTAKFDRERMRCLILPVRWNTV